jgi:UDP-N-acetylmuramate--alanine ligase
MHIYFSGIGGAGIGPLAQIAHQSGYQVSGSDKQDSSYIDYLRSHGISDIHIGQTREAIEQLDNRAPIDWFVYTSALPLENPEHPELVYCRDKGIRLSKRDELINQLLDDKHLKLIAVSGTHGKTTTTAMIVWLFKQLGTPLSYLLPAKTTFAEMGEYDPISRYFVYEADEFDRNFLAYKPYVSLITGVSWDHHELFPTREEYQSAFREFISQSSRTYIWQEDAEYLSVDPSDDLVILDSSQLAINELRIVGRYNRLDGWLAVNAVHKLTHVPIKDLAKHINDFPGLSRRMEQIVTNLYTDYAHTPEKIRGAISVAQEMAAKTGQKIIVIYEPLTNRRQHYMIDDYQDCFEGVDKVYWLPSYLAREDHEQVILPPDELIKHLSNPQIAEAQKRDDNLKTIIRRHLDNGDMVIGMAGGGGGSLDDWIRNEFDEVVK